MTHTELTLDQLTQIAGGNKEKRQQRKADRKEKRKQKKLEQI